MPEKATKANLKATWEWLWFQKNTSEPRWHTRPALLAYAGWQWFWFRADTREFTWRGRGVILAIAFIIGYMISHFLTDLLYCLIPDNTKKYLLTVNGAWARLVVTAVATIYSVPIFLGLWVIRTHDKKIEFRNHQEQMTRHAQDKEDDAAKHREQLSRPQIDKAVGLLVEKDPASRGLGVSRLAHLYRDKRISKKEYQGYMAICSFWASAASNVNAIVAPGADLTKAFLVKAYLQGAQLQGADLRGANLQEANLQAAYLEESKLQGANLHEAKLDFAKVNGCEMTETQRQLFIARKVDVRSVIVVDEPSSPTE